MNRLRELMNERELTTRELSKELGISHMSINYYEKEERDPSTDTLKKIADYFEVSIDYLLCKSESFIYALYSHSNESCYIKLKANEFKSLLDNKIVFYSFDSKHRIINLNSLFNIDEKVNLNNLLKDAIDVSRNKIYSSTSTSNNEFDKGIELEFINVEYIKNNI